MILPRNRKNGENTLFWKLIALEKRNAIDILFIKRASSWPK